MKMICEIRGWKYERWRGRDRANFDYHQDATTVVGRGNRDVAELFTVLIRMLHSRSEKGNFLISLCD